MDKEAQEALQRFKEQGLEQMGLSVSVQVMVFRKWHVDETSPDRIRWFFLDGISKDSIGTPFYVRAWWPLATLADNPLFEELDQIPMNSVLTLTSDSCTLESAEDFYLDGEKQSVEKGEDSPAFCLGMKAPELRKVICASERPNHAA